MSESVAMFPTSLKYRLLVRCDQWRSWRFEVTLSWREPTGDCRGPTSQHSEKM